MGARRARVAALDSKQRRRKRPKRGARAAVGQGMVRAQRSLHLSAFLRSASLPVRVPWEAYPALARGGRVCGRPFTAWLADELEQPTPPATAFEELRRAGAGAATPDILAALARLLQSGDKDTQR